MFLRSMPTKVGLSFSETCDYNGYSDLRRLYEGGAIPVPCYKYTK